MHLNLKVQLAIGAAAVGFGAIVAYSVLGLPPGPDRFYPAALETGGAGSGPPSLLAPVPVARAVAEPAETRGPEPELAGLGMQVRTLVERREFGTAARLLQSPPATAEPLIREFASAWVREEPMAAADWMLQLPPGPARARALAGALPVLVRSNDKAAARLIDLLPGSDEVDAAVASALNALPSDRRLPWLAELASNSTGGRYDRAIASRTAEFARDPDSTAAIAVLGQIRNPIDRRLATDEFIRSSQYRAPGQAIGAAIKLTDGYERDRLLTSLMAEWAQRDPLAAARYIREEYQLTEEVRSRLLAAVPAP